MTQTKELNGMFIHFFCLCPLGNTLKLNFEMSKLSNPLTVTDKSREHITDSFVRALLLMLQIRLKQTRNATIRIF